MPTVSIETDGAPAVITIRAAMIVVGETFLSTCAVRDR